MLGSAGSFAVLAGSAVTCTDSTVNGDVGVWPGTAITQTNCTINNGTVHPGDATAAAAHIDFLTEYNVLANTPCGVTISDAAFTGNVPALGPLAPGVYCFPAAATFTDTTLTLDGSTNPNGIWIFKVGAALAGNGFQVVMTNGAQPCNVFWLVGAAATLTTSTLPPQFQGSILAGAAITITGGTFAGDALATAAVTLTNTTASSCGGGTPSAGCKDFVTGGGWIDLTGGRKATFAVSGGFKHGKLFGHLTYVDHAGKDAKGKDTNDSTCDGMKVKGTGVTAYTVTGEKSRHIEGTAEINGKAGYTYKVDVVDNGEPGIDDKFSLSLSNGCSASSGDHLAGNIQLHKKCRPLICAPFKSDEDDDEGEGWHEVHD
jgi:hypothetical protein